MDIYPNMGDRVIVRGLGECEVSDLRLLDENFLPIMPDGSTGERTPFYKIEKNLTEDE